jgi:hypothetical protein
MPHFVVYIYIYIYIAQCVVHTGRSELIFKQGYVVGCSIKPEHALIWSPKFVLLLYRY